MEQEEKVLAAAQRSLIDKLREPLEQLSCKTPEEQEIYLLRDEERKLATVVLRSGAKNALSGRMISKLTEVIDQLVAWPEAKGVLIRGFGSTFCSGSDLVCVRQSASQESGLALAKIMQFNLMRLQRLPLVSVAFIEGYALGGGAELAMGADLRLISEGAKIGFVHVKVGVCCGWGGGSRLVRLLGPARAADLLASGRLVGATEAVGLGLANAVISTESDAIEYLAARTQGPKSALAALKSMLNFAQILPLERALQCEAQLFASTWGSDDHLRLLSGNVKHNRTKEDENKH